MKSSRLPAIVFGLVIVFLYLPILFLVVNSFNEARFSSTWAGFTLKWYAALFDPQNRDLWEATQRTLLIAIASSAVSMILGTLSACALHWYRTRLQRLNYGLIYLPIVIPDLLMGISLLLFFVALGVTLGTMTILIAHITFCSSFVTVVVLGRLQGFDESIIAAARDLGASGFTAVKRVFIPGISRGLLTAMALVLIPALGSYVIPDLVGGPGDEMIGNKIAQRTLGDRNLPQAATLSVALFLITLVPLIVVFYLNRRERTHPA